LGRTVKNLLKHEFIGLDVEVLSDSNYCNKGISGKIIDETMKTFIIQNKGLKRIAKENAVFKFKLNSETVKVEGKNLVKRPEDRIKKSKNRKW
jgi:ribonuclease P protein subunit POP4